MLSRRQLRKAEPTPNVRNASDREGLSMGAVVRDGHLDYIDALRGWAILLVIAVHVSIYCPGLPYPLDVYVAQGARGVQLFFVVSAVTLTLSWHQRGDGIIPFYIRRFFRIAPMFWFAIAFFTLLDGFAPRYWAPAGLSVWHVLATATFLHGWHPESITSVVPGGWSIAVEMTFYAIFPFLILACRSVKTSLIAFAAAIALAKGMNAAALPVLTSAVPAFPDYLTKTFLFLWFPSQLPIFILGLLVHHATKDIRQVVTPFQANIAAYLAIVLLVAMPLIGKRIPAPDHLKYGVVFAGLVYCYARGAHNIAINRVTRFIGTVSYSAYIWHFAVLTVLGDKLTTVGFNPLGLNTTTGAAHFAGVYLVVVMLTVTLSFMSYKLVEQPMIKLGSKIARRHARAEPIAI
jgi:peptidoglycan/LPS O-acetylase OafA/YrhL